MTGGVSHVDSFDPKPKLFADHGKTVTIDELAGQARQVQALSQEAALGRSSRTASAASRSATCSRTSAECVDDLCVIRSMQSDHTNHYEATLGMHTGSFTFARPSIGAWVSYGLGTREPQPAVVRRASRRTCPTPATRPGASDFLPGCHQGTHVVPGPSRSPNIQRRVAAAGCRSCELRPARASSTAATSTAARGDAALAARIRSFETAFGMQTRGAGGVRPVAGDRRDAGALRPAARQHARASPGNAWSPAGWPSAACASSS